MRGSALALLLFSACASAPARPVVRPTSAVSANAGSPDSARPSRPRDDPGALADEVHLRCVDGRCPAGVGMLIWGEMGALQRCTASLIGPDTAITASHCLPAAARRPGASCAGAWMTFPASREHPAEWVGCRAVLHAAPVRDEDVLRTDVATIRLARPLTREPLAVAFVPLEHAVVVTVAAVTPHPIYPLQHELSNRLCRVATRESARESFGAEANAVGWLVDCPSHPGNSGSPVLDSRGRIRAILHGGSAPIDGVGVTSRLGGLPAD